jgi:methylated-DNA-[protein]-cysteine S-methyltransferase
MTLTGTELATPIGVLALVATPAGVCALRFLDDDDEDGAAALARALARRFGDATVRPAADPAGAASRLRAYLDGDLRALDPIPVDAAGTPFQHDVWRALRALAPGATTSYGALAAAIGRPTAVRAVARANALNPVAVIVPCHRVIGKDGTLTGYAGGLIRKRWLLEHENAIERPRLLV